jgi:porin
MTTAHPKITIYAAAMAIVLSMSSTINFSVAQEIQPSEADTSAAVAERKEGRKKGQSSEGSGHFGGPASVDAQLRRDAKAKPTISKSYFDFKKNIETEHGLRFGIDYNALYQYANKSLGEDDAAGGVLRLFGNWELLNRGSENSGTLVYKVENRHRIATDITPPDLGSEIGYAGLTATAFSDKDWILTNLFWNQQLWHNRLAFVVGVVDTTDYVDAYSLVSPWSDFSNLAFSTDPTIPAPNQGLGLAISAMVTEQIYVLGGIADANGDPADPGDSFHSFFDTGEYFSHLELGWMASFDRRYTDNIHLTAWHADARKDAQVPGGWGLAFSYNHLFEERWEPFVRLGYAEDGGALWDRSVGVGLGYRPKRKDDQLSFGLNWSRPSTETFGDGLRDQYTAELYYRYQPLKILAITPDLQLLVNPSLNDNEDMIVVLGIRARLNF